MKKAVVFGAGNIGRGFIGRLLTESDFSICFIDISKDIVSLLNQAHSYTVDLLNNNDVKSIVVDKLQAALLGSDQAALEFAQCDIAFTAIGVNAFSAFAPVLAELIKRRMELNDHSKLDLILCENQNHADVMLGQHIDGLLDEQTELWKSEHIGLVCSTVGCMVPRVKPDAKCDPLLLYAEPYSKLQIDKLACKTDIFKTINGIEAFTPFEYYIKRKLFIHNCGHAVCAYLGYLKDYDYIWQAIEDPEIYKSVSGAMSDCARAIAIEYGDEVAADLQHHVSDLLNRFDNRALNDTVQRVAADPIRKLRSDDRLIGAANYCIERGIRPESLIKGIRAALQYNADDDSYAVQLQNDIREHGLNLCLENYCSLITSDELYKMILNDI